MVYRTKTYIAADWDHDKDVVDLLRQWNDNDHLNLNFHDAHEEMSKARDDSLNCSIMASLRERLDASKTFVLIVGQHTNECRAGLCRYCLKNNECGSTSNTSFIEYECGKAVRDNLKIIVIYKFSKIKKYLCPETVRDSGIHIPLYVIIGILRKYNYQAIKAALIEG